MAGGEQHLRTTWIRRNLFPCYIAGIWLPPIHALLLSRSLHISSPGPMNAGASNTELAPSRSMGAQKIAFSPISSQRIPRRDLAQGRSMGVQFSHDTSSASCPRYPRLCLAHSRSMVIQNLPLLQLQAQPQPRIICTVKKIKMLLVALGI